MDLADLRPKTRPDLFESFLFLDFDGVTHREGAPEARVFSRMPGIEQVLRRHPTVGVVISSAWRLRRTFEELLAPFSADIADRVVGTTPHLPDALNFQRQRECIEWIRANAHPWTPWLALDDRHWLFRPFCPNLLSVPWFGDGVGETELHALDERLTALGVD